MTATPRLRGFGLVLAGLLGCANAGAAPVYRCPQGRAIAYQQQPCADGVALSAGDARTPAQQDAARAATQRNDRVAQELARERQREAARAPAAATIGQRATLDTPAERRKPGPKKARGAMAARERAAHQPVPPTPAPTPAAPASPGRQR